ncbi:DUF2746 domain-containing protein [Kitasatospora sp. NPDC057940]|uniref:DUF2746 domain-containing protein n=1 Tax=Kitasatospora sp. NPDC057940 TaxID=3346285 RepID=UPI0036DD045A
MIEPTVQVALVSAGGAITAALAGVLVELVRRQSSTVAEVREQVANSHSTNLRDDLDHVIDRLGLVLDGQQHHSAELADLRREIAHERTERLAVADRLDSHLHTPN